MAAFSEGREPSAFCSVDSCVGVQPCVNRFVAPGSSFPVVHVGPYPHKVVHPYGSQPEPHRVFLAVFKTALRLTGLMPDQPCDWAFLALAKGFTIATMRQTDQSGELR
jgi:hypothetical protein